MKQCFYRRSTDCAAFVGMWRGVYWAFLNVVGEDLGRMDIRPVGGLETRDLVHGSSSRKIHPT